MKKGFTLIEIVLVILIIAILAAIIIPRINYAIMQAKYQACFANVNMINKQMALYHQQTGSWPAEEVSHMIPIKDANIGKDINYFPDGIPICPVTGHNYKLGKNSRVIGHDTEDIDNHAPDMSWAWGRP